MYRHLHEGSYAFAYKILRDENLARDVVSEVFLKTCVADPTFKDILAAKSYLKVALLSACSEHFRKSRLQRKVIPEVDGWPYNQGEYKSIVRLLETRELGSSLNRAVRRLPNRTRSVIILTMAGHNTDAIADTLSMSKQTVRNTRVRGIMELKRRILGDNGSAILRTGKW